MLSSFQNISSPIQSANRDSKEDIFMKGYAVESGYMGYENGAYMLFASETDYADYMAE